MDCHLHILHWSVHYNSHGSFYRLTIAGGSVTVTAGGDSFQPILSDCCNWASVTFYSKGILYHQPHFYSWQYLFFMISITRRAEKRITFVDDKFNNTVLFYNCLIRMSNKERVHGKCLFRVKCQSLHTNAEKSPRCMLMSGSNIMGKNDQRPLLVSYVIPWARRPHLLHHTPYC